MSAGIEFNANVLNQLGTPAMNSNLFANRPAAGFTGRIFISTDTREIYRDTGTTWELIGSGGGSVNIYNSDGTLTGNRTVNLGSNNLLFQGSGQFRINSTAGDAFKNFSATAALSRAPVNGVGYAILYTSNEAGYVGFQQRDGTSSRWGFQGLSEVLSANTIGLGIVYSGNLSFGNSTVEYMRLLSNGRLLLNTGTDNGFLANINGTLRVGGSITQQDTFSGSLTISHNANATHRITNVSTGNYFQFGPTNSIQSQADFIVNSGYDLIANRRIIMQSGNEFRIDGFFPGNDTKAGFNLFSTYNNIGAGGTNTAFFGNIIPSFVNATSGTYNLITLRNRPTYNFTNGTNNAIGYLYDPVLTSLTGFDHIAIQTNSGRVENYDRADLTSSNFTDRNIWTLQARLRQTLSAGADQAGAGYYVGGLHIREISASGANTYGNATINAGGASTMQIDFTGAGTLTASQSGLRAFAGHQIFNTFGGSASGTITHFAGMQILGLYNRNSGVITPTINNAYGLVINNLNDYSHTFTLTNRWGLYQTGASDNNYLAGKLLVGTTTVTARQVHINGDLELTTTLSGTAGSISGQHLNIWLNGNQYKIELRNP